MHFRQYDITKRTKYITFNKHLSHLKTDSKMTFNEKWKFLILQQSSAMSTFQKKLETWTEA